MSASPNKCPKCGGLRGQWDRECRACGFVYAEIEKVKEVEARKIQELAAGCPACKAPRKEGDVDCPQCGVVYAKIKAREDAARKADEERVAAIRGEAENRSSVDVSSTLRELGPGPEGPQKQRPGCLTAILFMMIVVNSLGGIGAVMMGKPLYILSSGSLVLFAIAALMWKRWGVIGIYFLYVIDMIMIFVLGVPKFFIVWDIVGLAVFMSFVRPVLYHFE
ncbi:MAG: hypothetical protein ABIJ96_14645 [Elusimicrobiota bacterium]